MNPIVKLLPPVFSTVSSIELEKGNEDMLNYLPHSWTDFWPALFKFFADPEFLLNI